MVTRQQLYRCVRAPLHALKKEIWKTKSYVFGCLVEDCRIDHWIAET
jgi:hypothetical protein